MNRQELVNTLKTKKLIIILGLFAWLQIGPFATPLFAQTLPVNQNSPSPNIESCFNYYDYGKVRTNLAFEKPAYHPGETAKIIGTIVNDNTFPLADIVLYAQLKRVNADEDFTRNGHYLVDRLTLIKDLNFLPGESKWVTAELPILPNYPNGEYQLHYYLFSKNLFHYAGRPFLEEDTAGLSTLRLQGGSDPVVYLDPATVMSGGTPYAIRDPITALTKSPIQFTFAVSDHSSINEDLSVLLKWYYFEDTSDELLVKTEQKTLAKDQNLLAVSFDPPDPGPYVLVAEIDSPIRSILKIRFAKDGTESKELRINDVDVANFPAGEQDRAWICVHSPMPQNTPETRVTLSLLDSAKKLIAENVVSRIFSGNVVAISLPMAELTTRNDFFLKAVLEEPRNPNHKQEVEIHYDCARFHASSIAFNLSYNPTQSALLFQGENGCGKTSAGYIESLRIRQQDKVVQEKYNLAGNVSLLPVGNLPPGIYRAEVKSGLVVKNLDFSVPSSPAKGGKVSTLVWILVTVIVVAGGFLLWKRRNKSQFNR